MNYPNKLYSLIILTFILIIPQIFAKDKKATIIFTGSNNGFYRDCG